MHWLRHKGEKAALGKSAKGVVLLGLLLSVLALANYSALHKAFHPNASNADHHCAVTLLASGQVEASSAAAAMPAPPVFLISFVLREPSFEAAPSFNLPLSRGPPALLS